MIVDSHTFGRLQRFEVWMPVSDWAELAEVAPPLMRRLLDNLVRKGEWRRMGGEYRPWPTCQPRLS